MLKKYFITKKIYILLIFLLNIVFAQESKIKIDTIFNPSNSLRLTVMIEIILLFPFFRKIRKKLYRKLEELLGHNKKYRRLQSSNL